MVSSAADMVNHDLIARFARSYTSSNMSARCRVVRMDDPTVTWDQVTAVEAKLLYEGMCRVYTVSGPTSQEVGDEIQYMSSSYVSLPYWVDNTQINDLIEITDHLDSSVIGRFFKVVDVDGGGQWQAVRRHQVTSAQKYSGWTWALHG